MKKLISIVTLSLIFMCGMLLVGCNGPSGPLSISLNVDKIEMLITDESQDYIISLENYGNNISFDFGFEKNYAKVISSSVKSIGEGKYQFSIAPLSSGSTWLKITIRGTDKYIDVPVEITEELESFSAKSDIFVIKGESITLTNSLFNFVPESTTLKNLSFKIKEDQELGTDCSWNAETNTLSTSAEAVLNEVVFVATSTNDDSKFCEFTVKLVDKIDYSSLNIFAISQYQNDEDKKEEFDDINGRQLVYGYKDDQLVNESIELITNKDTLFQKKMQVEFNFNGEYRMNVYSSEGIIGEIDEGTPKLNMAQNFNFVIQANEVTQIGKPYELTFRVFRPNFPANFEEVKVKVYAVVVPDEIRINSKRTMETVNLYHNSGVSTDFRFLVYPSIDEIQTKEKYEFAIKMYKSDNGIALGDLFTSSEISQYMNITYGGVNISELVTSSNSTIVIEHLPDLSSIMKITPNIHYGAYFVIVLECWDKTTNEVVCSNTLPIKVHKGTSAIYLDPDKFENNTLFIPMPDSNDIANPYGTQRFEGLQYDSDSVIGTLRITAIDMANVCCGVEQDIYSQNPVLNITPYKVGSSEFILETENNKSVRIKVVVFREIQQSDFSIVIDSDEKNDIASLTTRNNYGKTRDTLESVVIRGLGGELNIKELIYNYLDTNEFSYDYSIELAGNEQDGNGPFFELDGNKIISKEYTNGLVVTAKVTLNLYKCNAFNIEPLSDDEKDVQISFDFNLTCVDYIKKLNITVSDGAEDSQKTKEMFVYNKKNLSYINQNLAEAYIYLDLETNSSINENLKNPDVSSSINKLPSNVGVVWNVANEQIGENGAISNIGYFYPSEGDEPYIGKFVCDISGISNVKSFIITLELTDETGVSYKSNITINIGKYIDVDSIYLTAPDDIIYLDNTESNKTKSISTLILPENAMCKDVLVVIDTADTGCIAYFQKDNTITFTYISGGSGKIRLFPISKMKTSEPKDEYGNYYYHIALDFRCADGTSPETAIRINNYDDLAKINSYSHYYLDSVIDCGGRELYIKNFSGTIRGTFAVVPNTQLLVSTGDEALDKLNQEKYANQVQDFEKCYQTGGIINFKVKNNGANSGMIGTLASTGKLDNLIISGYFDNSAEWLIEQDTSYAGILCGINEGTISNVEVSLYNEQKLNIKNSLEQETSYYLGIVAGSNSGNILITNNSKNSTLIINLNNKLEVSFSDNELFKVSSYVGGIAGNNTGNIINSNTTQKLTIGLYGVNANVNLKANANYFGGIVGNHNNGEIKNIKAIGFVECGISTRHISGFIGLYSNESAKVLNNTVRTFVKCLGSVSGLIAYFADGVEHYNNITQNKVQATDGGKIGLNATMLVAGTNVYPIALVTPYEDMSKVKDNVKQLIENNICETYVDRVHSTQTNTTIVLAEEYYYGDYVVLNSNIITKSGCFNRGIEEDIAVEEQSFALAIYKKAKDLSQQSNIVNIVDLEKILSNIAVVSGSEFSVQVNKTSIANVINYGKNLSINGTGILVIEITSSLNYKQVINITIGITNYFSHFNGYIDKGYNVEANNLTVINGKTKNIYFNFYAPDYIYKNTPISLESNQEVTFNVNEINSSYLNISVLQQIINIGAKQQINNTANLSIKPIFMMGVIPNYAVKNEEIGCYVFKPTQTMPEQTQIGVIIETGIENIKISKAEIFAEPSNDIEFEVTYDTYNTQDYLDAYIHIDDNTYQISWNADKNFGTFKDNAGLEIFNLTKRDTINLGELTYKELYTLNMVINQSNYLNYKNSNIIVELKSVKTNENAKVQISYNAETITTVMLNNYSTEENPGMIDDKKYDIAYYEQNIQKPTIFSSTGDYNIIKAHIYTKLGEFDYAEVSMNVGISGGYLAIGKSITTTSLDGTVTTKGITNKNVVYTSIGGVVSLKVNKSDLISNEELFGNEERVLEMTIIYSLPTAMADNIRVPITLNFFKFSDNNPISCYQPQTIYVVSKNTKRVEISIVGKEVNELNEQEVDLKADQSYSVVKGKTYALISDIFGYESENIVFESSNPNLVNIQVIDNQYYLQINNINISYEDKEYYTAIIYSYGTQMENGVLVKGKIQTTILRIYDVYIDEIGGIFGQDKLALKVLTTVDIREEIASLIKLEYASYNKSVEGFINSFINNEESNKWKLIANDIEIDIPTTRVITTTQYKVSGYNFQPLKTALVAPYTFKISYAYTYKNGVPTCNIEKDDKVRTASFTFNVEVYLSSSEDIPSPIEKYEDLLNIKNNEHYILVDNIEIPGNEFKMITNVPASFDGNGYNIIIKGDNFGANLMNVSNFALFESVGANSVFKNINIIFKNTSNIIIDNNFHTTGVNVGVLAAINEGVITNCSIVSEFNINIKVASTVSNMENSYFGSICALNRGYITNARVQSNLSFSGVSFGGICANNEGKISSSYIKNSRILNEYGGSSENIIMGGFVGTNTGSIAMSYIEGKQYTSKIFADFTKGQEQNINSKIINTSSETGAFAYKNDGLIEDCYSNIPVVSTNRCAGFIAINNGSIKKSFSLSKMKQNDTLNHGFVINYNYDAIFEDCFFIVEKGIINDFTSETNYKRVQNGNNVQYYSVIQGITPLTIEQFNIIDNNGVIKENNPFANFIIGMRENDSSGIWFYNYDSILENETTSSLQSYVSNVEAFNYYDPNTQEFISQSFTARVLHLSSPNLITSSRQTLNVYGDGTYNYSYDDKTLASGTQYNPYLITSAKDLENYANQKNTSKFEYFKLVKDIDYSNENIYNSKLFNKTLFGYFEGNNFEISNYVINAKNSLVSAGLFAQIGKENSTLSTFKNAQFKPSYINLPNSVYVGGVAGTVAGTKAYNIRISGENIVITGKNFVGGLFGRTTGQTYIRQIYSDIIAKATYFNSDILAINDMNSLLSNIVYKETSTSRAKSSYAGSLIGHIGGSSLLKNASVGENAKAFGIMSGLMFGGIGVFADVSQLTLNLNSINNEIHAYGFGGIVVGENSGALSKIEINSDILNKTLFSTYPILPVAIGGIAGLMINGNISDVNSTRGYNVIGADFTGGYLASKDGYVVAQINNPYVVKYVGGIVGYLKGGNISNINIFGLTENEEGKGNYNIDKNGIITEVTATGKYDKDLTVGLIVCGANFVGGVIGYSDSETLTISKVQINLVGHKKYVNQDDNEIDELIYMSYLSEVSSHLINDFDKNVYVGTLVGLSKKQIENNNIFIQTNYSESHANEKIYTYYALYSQSATKPSDARIPQYSIDNGGSVTTKWPGIALNGLNREYICITTGLPLE